ncbi:hypothetical protein DFH28DRAFT_914665 [Melampsora americana]|nr:hypothetical protein DFH28DRAFT_914665 [Melampsora americana]
MRSLSTCFYALYIFSYTQSGSAFTLQPSNPTNQVASNNTSNDTTGKTDTKPPKVPVTAPPGPPPSTKTSTSALDIPVPPPSFVKSSPEPKAGANNPQTTQPPSANKASPLPTDPGKPKLSATHGNCTVLPLSPATWKQLKIDDYLKNYPGGKTMKLIDYATAKNASNFVCGIGEKCNIGQPCFPLGGVDWYVLFAVQAWNTYMNNFYLAVGYAMSMVQC